MTTKTGASFARGKSNQNYQTPWELIRSVEKRFGKICIDLAATEADRRCPVFIPPEQNSLKGDWGNRVVGTAWLNPPFGDITPWARKCSEWLLGYRSAGSIIIMLTPASVGSNWWRDYVHNRARVAFLNGRIKFVGANDPYTKDCALSVYGLNPGCEGYEVWDWRKGA